MITIINAPKNLCAYKEDIKTLIKLAYSASFDILFEESFIDEKFKALQNYLNNKQCYLLLAKQKYTNQIVGFCHFFIKNECNEKIAHLNQISVLQAFQGKRFIRKDKNIIENTRELKGTDIREIRNGGGMMPKNTSIARELIIEMEQTLRKKHITKLDLFVSSHNTKALNLYKDIGFKEKRKLMIKDLYV